MLQLFVLIDSMDSWFFLSFSAELVLDSSGDPQEAKNLAGKNPPPDSDPYNVSNSFTELCTNLSSQAPPDFYVGLRLTQSPACFY
jgi:hypothetical protein